MMDQQEAAAQPDHHQQQQPQQPEGGGPGEEPPASSPAASPGASPSKGAYGLVLTLNRIKTFIKEDAEVKSISTEACFAVARATELLLEAMAQRASQAMLEVGREELEYNDLAGTVASWEALDFLHDIVPRKVPAALVLERMK